MGELEQEVPFFVYIDRLAVTAAAIRITLHVLVALRRRASYTYGMHG